MRRPPGTHNMVVKMSTNPTMFSSMNSTAHGRESHDCIHTHYSNGH